MSGMNANPEEVAAFLEHFATEIRAGRLSLVHYALERPPVEVFYPEPFVNFFPGPYTHLEMIFEHPEPTDKPLPDETRQEARPESEEMSEFFFGEECRQDGA